MGCKNFTKIDITAMKLRPGEQIDINGYYFYGRLDCNNYCVNKHIDLKKLLFLNHRTFHFYLEFM